MKKEIRNEEMLNDEQMEQVVGGSTDSDHVLAGDSEFLYDMGLYNDTPSFFSVRCNLTGAVEKIIGAWAKIGVQVMVVQVNNLKELISEARYYHHNGTKITRHDAYAIASQVTGKRLKSNWLKQVGWD